jgi:DNA polymerase-3 subunit gamma/tau
MRDAESLLERLVAFSEETINDARVGEILGIADRKTLFDAADAVLARDAKRALEIVDRVYESGRDLERLSRDLLEHWRNLVVVKLGAGETILAEVPAEEREEYARQSASREISDLQRLFRIARLGDEELARSSVPRMVLEMTMVRLATAEPLLPVDQVLARLDEIERDLGTASAVSSDPAPTANAPSRPAMPPPRPRPAPARSNGESSGESPSKPAPSAAPPREAPAADGRWPALLEFVQRRKLGLYLSLSHARCLRLEAGAIVLGVAREKFRNELASKMALSQLEELISEFHGAPTRVRIEAIAEEAEAAAPPPSVPELLEHPKVKAAVEILGGEVREVRPRR